MAKIAPGIIKLKGKIGNNVFTQGTKYGEQIKKAVAPGSKRNEAGLKEQYNRTAYLNKLAAEINKVIGLHDGHFKSSDFYTRLHKLFRKEPLNNRFLLLNQLKEMEVNPKYPMKRLGETLISAGIKKNKMMVMVEAISHPHLIKYKDNCYFFEVILLQWDNTQNEATKTIQRSDWVDMKKGGAGFEFLFHLPAKTKHWLLCLHKRMGIDQITTDLMATKGMLIVTAGTFDKNDLAILEKREKEKSAARVIAKKEEEKVVKVKAKWVR